MESYVEFLAGFLTCVVLFLAVSGVIDYNILRKM